MALRISDEENQKLNPGQVDADREFALNLNNAEKKTDPAGFAEENSNDSEQNDGIDNVDRAENNPDNNYINNYTGQKNKLQEKQGKFNERKEKGKYYRGLGKSLANNPLAARLAYGKKGPLMAIILTVVGGGIGISTLFSPGLLLVHIKETLFNNLNDASPALHTRTNRMLIKKIKGTGHAFKYSKAGKCGIQCKFGTMSDTMKENLKKKGFTVETESAGIFKNRHIITRLVFPTTGDVATTKAEYDTAMKNHRNAVDYNRVFNSKIIYFMNSKFGQVIAKKFGINKINEIVKGGLDKAKASIRRALGLPELGSGVGLLDAARANPRFKNTFKFIDGPLKKYSNLMNNAVNWVCTVYNVGKGITYATKVAKIAAFVGFAMLFLKAADQIKAGDADESAITALGDQLTATEVGSDKSAMDSRGYKMAAYGDSGNGALTPDEEFSSAGPGAGALGIFDKLLASIGTILLVPVLLRQACRAAQNIAWDIADFALKVGEAASVVGLVVDLLIDAGTAALISLAISTAISALTTLIVNEVTPILNEDTIGDKLGNSLFTGTAQMMGSASASYGLKAGTQEEIRQYAIDTADIRQQQDDIARYEAKDTPFDIYNQYSFLGSMIKNTNMYAISNSSSFMSFFGNILSIIPKSLATMTSNVGAVAENKAALYAPGKCDDLALTQIVTADVFCNPSYVMSNEEMNTDIDEAVDYMIANDFIDDEAGEVIFDGHYNFDTVTTSFYLYKNDYKNYLDNCAYRTATIGESATAIESNYKDWETGLNCTRTDSGRTNPLDPPMMTDDEWNQMMRYFRVYTMDKSVSDTMNDEEPDDPLEGSMGWSVEEGQYQGADPTDTIDPTDPPELPSAESQRLAQAILNSGKVTDSTGQLQQIADGNPTYVNQKILFVLGGLSTSFKFNITDLYNPNRSNSASKHIIGNAVDVNNIIMGGSMGSLNSGSYNTIVQTFINQAAFLFGGSCGLGVPNSQYINGSRGSCDVFIDNKQPHIHLDVR